MTQPTSAKDLLEENIGQAILLEQTLPQEVDHEDPGRICHVRKTRDSDRCRRRGLYEIEYYEHVQVDGNSVTVRTKTKWVSKAFLTRVFIPSTWTMLEEIFQGLPEDYNGWLNIYSVAMFAGYVESLELVSVMPSPECTYILTAKRNDCNIHVHSDTLDELPHFFSPGWELPKQVANQHQERNPEPFIVPGGSAEIGVKEAEEIDLTHFEVLENEAPNPYVQKSHTSTCFRDAICNAAARSQDPRVTDHLTNVHAELCKIPTLSGKVIEDTFLRIADGMWKGIIIDRISYDPLVDKWPPFPVFGYLKAKLHYLSIAPATTFDGAVLSEPAIKQQLALTKENLDAICGGDGEYKGFDYFYCICTHDELLEYVMDRAQAALDRLAWATLSLMAQ